MKKRLIIGTVVVFSIAACSLSEDEFRSNGTITGFDLRECSCCGGYYIDIDEQTNRFYTIPDDSKLNLVNPVFPINVKLDWSNDPNACLGDEIIVLKIEER